MINDLKLFHILWGSFFIACTCPIPTEHLMNFKNRYLDVPKVKRGLIFKTK